jgi:hypothetical protein
MPDAQAVATADDQVGRPLFARIDSIPHPSFIPRLPPPPLGPRPGVTASRAPYPPPLDTDRPPDLPPHPSPPPTPDQQSTAPSPQTCLAMDSDPGPPRGQALGGFRCGGLLACRRAAASAVTGMQARSSFSCHGNAGPQQLQLSRECRPAAASTGPALRRSPLPSADSIRGSCGLVS